METLADEKKTNMVSGCLSIQSKNVARQIKYEAKKAKQPSSNLSESLEILRQQYMKNSACKNVQGFIQHKNEHPLVIGLWTDDDIRLYREMV